ncbi:MAG: 3-hydroxy-5-phosphonooxypentane-2,4-dione thiolase LsrF [Deltaproteobacteria bacterium]
MRNRLSRLIGEDGRCQFLPIDHGYFQGPTHCLEQPGETIRDLLPYADGLFEVITTSVEEMIRLNVAAVGVSIFVGSDYEKQTLENLSELVNICEDYGIPVMAVTAVGKELEKRQARYLALSCRIAAELGAKIVKTYYCPEDFDLVTSGCPVPVVMAGGPKCDTALEVLQFVHDGLQKGAIGVNLGRNVWQHPHPTAMMQALHAVIHEDVTPEEALALFEKVKGG